MPPNPLIALNRFIIRSYLQIIHARCQNMLVPISLDPSLLQQCTGCIQSNHGLYIFMKLFYAQHFGVRSGMVDEKLVCRDVRFETRDNLEETSSTSSSWDQKMSSSIVVVPLHSDWWDPDERVCSCTFLPATRAFFEEESAYNRATSLKRNIYLDGRAKLNDWRRARGQV